MAARYASTTKMGAPNTFVASSNFGNRNMEDVPL